MAFAKRLGRFWLILVVFIAVLLCHTIAARIVGAVDYETEYSDFVPFWLAGNMVAQGDSPYDANLWVAGYTQNGVGEIIDHSFLYPLPLALLFVPLGLLPLRTAHALWVTVTLLVILGAVLAVSAKQASPKAKSLFIPILIGVLFFRPVVLTLVTGHISGLFLFLVSASFLLFEKNKPFWGGLLLAFLLLKPNLGVLIVSFLLIWLLRRSWRSGFLGMAAAGLFLLAAGLLVDPHWLAEYWQVGSGKLVQAFGFSPTVWGLAYLACGTHHACTLAAGGIAAALFGFTSLWLLASRRRSLTPLWAFSLSIAVTLLVTPYTWTYDQLLLLLPIAAVTFSLGERKGGYLPAALLFLGIDILSVFLLFFNTALDVEILNAIIPLAVLVLVIWMLLRKNEPQNPEAPPIQAGMLLI